MIMIKLICAVFVLLLVLPTCAISGGVEETMDSYYVFSSPGQSDKYVKVRVILNYDSSGNHNAIIQYQEVDPEGRVLTKVHPINIQNYPDDDPATPYDETTMLSDYIQGIAATLDARTKALIEADLVKRHGALVPK